MGRRSRRPARARDRLLLLPSRRRTPSAVGGRIGAVDVAGRARHRGLARPASPLHPELGAQLGARRGGHHSRRHPVGGAPAVRGRSVAADGRGDAARGARSRRLASDGPRLPHHARVLSDRERCGASAPVGRLRLDVSVRARGPGASVPAPHRRRLSGVLDAPLWPRRRASRPPRRPEHDVSRRRACG